MTINLANGTYRAYKKANDSLLYINTSFSHPLQVIMPLPTLQLTIAINERLSENSSSEEIFNASKYESELLSFHKLPAWVLGKNIKKSK